MHVTAATRNVSTVTRHVTTVTCLPSQSFNVPIVAVVKCPCSYSHNMPVVTALAPTLVDVTRAMKLKMIFFLF